MSSHDCMHPAQPRSQGRGRVWLLLVACVMSVTWAATPCSMVGLAMADRVAHPPARRVFTSPGNRYRCVVETTDAWKTPQPTVTLYRLDADQAVPLWSRLVPHHHGPREVVVSDAGQVLLVDEWINVQSRYTLMLLDVTNRVLATYDHAAATGVLGVSVTDLAAQARRGTWMSSGPTLAPDGQSARIAAGGRTLVIGLEDGRLSAAP